MEKCIKNELTGVFHITLQYLGQGTDDLKCLWIIKEKFKSVIILILRIYIRIFWKVRYVGIDTFIKL